MMPLPVAKDREAPEDSQEPCFTLQGATGALAQQVTGWHADATSRTSRLDPCFAQPLKKSFRLLQICRVKAFGEPAIERGK